MASTGDPDTGQKPENRVVSSAGERPADLERIHEDHRCEPALRLPETKMVEYWLIISLTVGAWAAARARSESMAAICADGRTV